MRAKKDMRLRRERERERERISCQNLDEKHVGTLTEKKMI